jgi:hypothetical protein
MAKQTKTTTQKQITPKTTTLSPFSQKAKFEGDIKIFLNRYKTVVISQSKRLSDYFEMNCFNLIVRYYLNNGYSTKVMNLQNKKYRYKCSPAGLISNFSFFTISKTVGKKMYEFEILHNLAVQSSHCSETFTKPDIAVVKAESSKIKTDYYDTKRALCYVENKDLVTFCEVKMFVPFPELLFNYIGVLNELRKEVISNKSRTCKPIHLAPSLMISGKANKPAQRIIDNLQDRYCINVICDLHNSGLSTFNKQNVKKLRQTGKLPST